MDLEVRKQKRTSRTCILISLKDKTEYPFNSLADADKFLGRQHGYLSGCVKNGSRITGFQEDGELERFDILLGPSMVSESVSSFSTPQPCWTCKNCYDGCNWSRCFKPVEGWDAIPIIKDGDITYNIKYCPEYKSDRKDKKWS